MERLRRQINNRILEHQIRNDEEMKDDAASRRSNFKSFTNEASFKQALFVNHTYQEKLWQQQQGPPQQLRPDVLNAASVDLSFAWDHKANE